ncbi:MAG TPA: hypothetical protein VFS83_02735 [Ktedonobacterales bacterium]|nr:hypothetical protein [Ktedonobacterales bacterium]
MDEQTNTPPQTPNDEAGLRELALALIAARYPDATDETGGEGPQLLPGKLPPSFPGDFPLPPGAHVIGSLVAARPTIALDTDQSGEEVITFFTEQLTAAGWNAPEGVPPRQGGFVHSSFGMAGRTHALFYRDDGPGLNLVTQTTANGRTSVLISQMPDETGPMRHGPRSRMMHYDIFSILPVIMPPPRSQQFQEGGSGGGGDRVIANARVETDLDLAALAAHYTAQLERGGWLRTDGGENDPVAWSTWNFEGEEKEPWRAFFVILKRPDVPRRYWAHIIAEWAGEQPRGGTQVVSSVSTSGGWFSYAPLTRRPT